MLISWTFQTLGILVGSIWAYYELGWGGFGSGILLKMPRYCQWFTIKALIHPTSFGKKKFSLFLDNNSLFINFHIECHGYLVRSGILNSVHTFANDPSGEFIFNFSFDDFNINFLYLKNINQLTT